MARPSFDTVLDGIVSGRTFEDGNTIVRQMPTGRDQRGVGHYTTRELAHKTENLTTDARRAIRERRKEAKKQAQRLAAWQALPYAQRLALTAQGRGYRSGLPVDKSSIVR